MADSEPLYSAEQIKVPDELPQILKEYTKEIIRAAPSDLITWSAEYFQKKMDERKKAAGGAGSGH